jgi:hypothetical protein
MTSRVRRIVLVALLAGCARNTSKPLNAVDAYVEALKHHNFGAAYDLMSEKYRREHSREEFIRQLKQSPQEVDETAAALSTEKRSVEVAAHMIYGDLHDSLELAQEEGAWKIVGDPLDYYPQDDPRSALKSFLRALKHKRYDIVMRLVPDKWKEGMTVEVIRAQFEGDKKEEVENMENLLTANIEGEIQLTGDTARMPYGERFEVKFKREDGVWKIDDPD